MFFAKGKRDLRSIQMQIMGFQSVIFEIFASDLGVSDGYKLRKECTYFSCALYTFAYLSFYKKPNTKLLDDAIVGVMTRSAQNAGNSSDFRNWPQHYRERFQEYGPLFTKVLPGQADDVAGAACSQIIALVYQHATGCDSHTASLKTATLFPEVSYWVLDAGVFCKELN